MIDAVGNIISITLVIILIITLILPKKIRGIVHAIFLFLFGLIPILFRLKLLGVTFEDTPQLAYAVLFIIVIAGRTMMVEGIKIESKVKWPIIIFGVIIIILTTIPALHDLGALSFTLPPWSTIINEIIYVFAAVFLVIVTFMADSD